MGVGSFIDEQIRAVVDRRCNAGATRHPHSLIRALEHDTPIHLINHRIPCLIHSRHSCPYLSAAK